MDSNGGDCPTLRLKKGLNFIEIGQGDGVEFTLCQIELTTPSNGTFNGETTAIQAKDYLFGQGSKGNVVGDTGDLSYQIYSESDSLVNLDISYARQGEEIKGFELFVNGVSYGDGIVKDTGGYDEYSTSNIRIGVQLSKGYNHILLKKSSEYNSWYNPKDITISLASALTGTEIEFKASESSYDYDMETGYLLNIEETRDYTLEVAYRSTEIETTDRGFAIKVDGNYYQSCDVKPTGEENGIAKITLTLSQGEHLISVYKLNGGYELDYIKII